MAAEPAATAEAARYLARHRVLVLAVTTAEGPWAAPVYYALWEGSLLFLSHSGSRHAQAIGEQAVVSGAVTAAYRQPQLNRGIQLRGICRPVPADAVDAARARYLRRLPFAQPFLAERRPAQTAAPGFRFYRLFPQEVWWVDNRRGFGRVVLPELEFPAPMVHADGGDGPSGPMGRSDRPAQSEI